MPLASLRLKDVIEVIYLRLDEASAMQFLQLTGMCGLSSSCSAFYYYFDTVIARKWMESSDGFSKVTGKVTSQRSKKSFEINHLFRLLMKLKGGIYFTYRMKNMIKWTVLKNDAEYFNSIIICLIKCTNEM